jgi:branched-chain amino acid transport system substrate-binding protein
MHRPRTPRVWCVLTLCLALIVVTAGCASPQPAAAIPEGPVGVTYKIGFMAAITGRSSSLGEPERDVAVMIQKRLDAEGGIIGPDGVRHPVKILIHDTEGSGDVALPVAKKLIDTEGVAALIGPTTSPVAMALIPVVQEARVPMLAMASSSAIVQPAAERKWVFKVAQSNEHTAPWQVRYAREKGLLRIANLYVNNAYGEDGASAIRATARQEGLTIVLEDTFGEADSDMTAQITKIKASNAQAVLVTAIPPAAAIFTKQYRELGANLPLLHNSGIGMQSFIDLAGAENAEGVIFPIGKIVAADALSDSDPQKAVLDALIREYKAHTGKMPNQFAAHAWDCLEIVLHVLRTFPDGLSVEEQRTRLRDGIENLSDFVGADGMFNFSPQDHVGLSMDDVVLVRISNGAWTYLPPEKW